jgi:anti-sigma B factor antagonist
MHPSPDRWPLARAFSVDVERRGRVAVLRVQGELDIATAAEFAAQVLAATADSSCVVIDFAALTFFDCTALRVLERSIQAARDEHVQIEIAAVPPKVARFLDLAGVELPLSDRPPF